MTRFAMYPDTANGDARSVVRGNILKIELWTRTTVNSHPSKSHVEHWKDVINKAAQSQQASFKPQESWEHRDNSLQKNKSQRAEQADVGN